jgi:uncharacterized tellurite resistance protein B-like protein
MLSYLKKILMPQENSAEETSLNPGKEHDKKIQLATCILLVEIANADNQFSGEEIEKIISTMQRSYDLGEDEIRELIHLAQERRKTDISIYEYTNIISRSFSNDEKYELLKKFWHLVYTHKSMDKYEEQIVKKIGMLINVDYRDIISAKIQVKKDLKI